MNTEIERKIGHDLLEDKLGDFLDMMEGYDLDNTVLYRAVDKLFQKVMETEIDYVPACQQIHRLSRNAMAMTEVYEKAPESADNLGFALIRCDFEGAGW